jgi:hypothetical protein
VLTQIDLADKLVQRLRQTCFYHADLRMWVHIERRDGSADWEPAKLTVFEEAKDIARWACSEATGKNARTIGTYKFILGMIWLAKWDVRLHWSDEDLLTSPDAPWKVAVGREPPKDSAGRLLARFDKPDDGLH